MMKITLNLEEYKKDTNCFVENTKNSLIKLNLNVPTVVRNDSPKQLGFVRRSAGIFNFVVPPMMFKIAVQGFACLLTRVLCLLIFVA